MRGDVDGWWWAPVTRCSGQVWAGVGVNDERAVAWPVRAFARGSGDGGMWVGGGEKTSSDGTLRLLLINDLIIN